MKQIRHTLTHYSQIFRHKIVSILLLAGTAAAIITVPVSAATNTTYGSGTYGGNAYGTTTSAGTPNTGDGRYIPNTAKYSHTVSWVELGGGALLVIVGASGFWFMTMRKRHDQN